MFQSDPLDIALRLSVEPRSISANSTGR